MTNPQSTGAASRWPLPDPRTDDQRERDKEAVRRQVDVLTDANGDSPTRRRLADVVDRIQRRQRSAAEGVATPFVRLGGDREVLAAEGEVVIRGLVQDPAGYTRARQVGRGAGLYRPHEAKGVAGLRADVRKLREQNIRANVNPIVPLGYVIKGDAYPGLTAARPAFPAAPIDGSVRVAIVDTGLTAEARTDSWFDGIRVEGTDPLNVIAPLDRNDWFAGHGTFTAGIVRQVAPSAEIAIYRFTGPDGIGTDTAAADVLRKAVEDGAGRRLIINASFGVPAVDGTPPLALQDAVEEIAELHPEVLIVASAGNDGVDELLYPAGFDQPNVIAVGAVREDLTPADFSNRGPWVRCSSVGVGVVSTFVRGKLPPEDDLGVADLVFGPDAWATWSGTSFTAPQISGAVAALCGDDAARTPRQALDLLLEGRQTLAGFGAIVHLLPGTPTT